MGAPPPPFPPSLSVGCEVCVSVLLCWSTSSCVSVCLFACIFSVALPFIYVWFVLLVIDRRGQFFAWGCKSRRRDFRDEEVYRFPYDRQIIHVLNHPSRYHWSDTRYMRSFAEYPSFCCKYTTGSSSRTPRAFQPLLVITNTAPPSPSFPLPGFHWRILRQQNAIELNRSSMCTCYQAPIP